MRKLTDDERAALILRAKTNETTMQLTDSELSLLVLGLLITGKLPKDMRDHPGFETARRNVTAAMDWLLEVDAFSDEEAAGWHILREAK
jgi:hypothetical protein